MHFSMEFHAAATQVSTNLRSILVGPAPKELHGTAIPVGLRLPEPALQAIFSTKIQINASLQPLPVETMRTSTGHVASV